MRMYARMVSALGIVTATTVFLGAQAGVRFVPDDVQDTSWLELDASGQDRAHRDAAGAAGATGRVAVRGARGTRSVSLI